MKGILSGLQNVAVKERRTDFEIIDDNVRLLLANKKVRGVDGFRNLTESEQQTLHGMFVRRLEAMYKSLEDRNFTAIRRYGFGRKFPIAEKQIIMQIFNLEDDEKAERFFRSLFETMDHIFINLPTVIANTREEM